MSSTTGTLPLSISEELGRSPIVSALLAQLPIGIVITSGDGKPEYVNATADAFLTAHHQAQSTLEPWSRQGHGESGGMQAIRWIVARALLTNEVIRDEEVEYVNAHDERRTLSVSATPIGQSAAAVDRVVVTFDDVTERNRGRDWAPLVRSLSRL